MECRTTKQEDDLVRPVPQGKKQPAGRQNFGYLRQGIPAHNLRRDSRRRNSQPSSRAMPASSRNRGRLRELQGIVKSTNLSISNKSRIDGESSTYTACCTGIAIRQATTLANASPPRCSLFGSAAISTGSSRSVEPTDNASGDMGPILRLGKPSPPAGPETGGEIVSGLRHRPQCRQESRCPRNGARCAFGPAFPPAANRRHPTRETAHFPIPHAPSPPVQRSFGNSGPMHPAAASNSAQSPAPKPETKSRRGGMRSGKTKRLSGCAWNGTTPLCPETEKSRSAESSAAIFQATSRRNRFFFAESIPKSAKRSFP